MTGISACPYIGGKTRSAHGRWVRSMLPYRQGYAELYAGMAGCLLNRRPSRYETLNDLDDRIVDWWQAVRDHQPELSALLDDTPVAESEYLRCLDHINDREWLKRTPLLERARAVTVVLCQSMRPTLTSGRTNWNHRASRRSGGQHHSRDQEIRLARNLPKIADRLRSVILQCRPAVELIERYASIPSFVVYLDPPYAAGVTWRHYAADDRDDTAWSDVVEILADAEAAVLISGYGDDWDPLLQHRGWQRHQLRTNYFGTGGTNDPDVRDEVVWANYQVTQQQSLI